MTTSAVLPMPEGRVHLAVLSTTAISTFRRCPREFKYRYVMRRRPRRSDEALRFGTFFHVGLNAWWAAEGHAETRLSRAIEAMASRAKDRDDDSDPYDLAKAVALMMGYSMRWGDEDYETVAVEREFDVPLVNPSTGAVSKTYRMHGKIDVIARRNGKLYQVEHKTTSEDIGLGADYWRRVSALDPQVSTYLSACRASGFDVEECIYDVIRKIALKPKLATPEDKRRYTKKGILDARQRETDETVEEFFERCCADIAEKPEKYYARGPIVRLEHDEKEHAGDVWQSAWMIRESENAGRWPRSPNACERYHRLCEYFDVCSGQASIDDDTRFRSAERAHEELSEV